MKIISLGGIGGCDLAKALRDLNQPAYPYDWLAATQTFVIDSFNDINNFFIFKENYVYENDKLLVYNKKALMLHDFKNFSLQKEEIISKYKRRFERLNETLNADEDILFVRIYDNLQEELYPITYNNVLIRDEESIKEWEKFINIIKNKYNKKVKLLIITSKEDIYKGDYDNIIIQFTKEHKNSKAIYNIIKDLQDKII